MERPLAKKPEEAPRRLALVVDDMRVNRRVLEVRLVALGFDCREAASGPEAISACEDACPDVIFLDVVMPGMDGFEALEHIRRVPRCADVPVILLTGLKADDIETRAKAAGAAAVIAKPPDPARLKRALRRFVPARSGAKTAALPRRAKRPVRVLVVDDSALIRELLSQVLSASADIEVVGTARDANAAWRRLQALKPDVLTLDVEMPGMDGLTFLERLMRLRPMPVIMISSRTERGSSETLRALELGAVDFVCKPKIDIHAGTTALAKEIISKVRMAAHARLPARPERPIPAASSDGYPRVTRAVVALGASTGGPKALTGVVQALPLDFPPVLVTQHMPSTFTASFAARLDATCTQRVLEAQGGEPLRRGCIYIAPGHAHLRAVPSSKGPITALDHSPRVNHHRPSVDVLFESIADLYGANAVAALLTGMGEDGARGLFAMRAAGARTIAQDENSSLVYGMPRVAAELGAAEHILPLARIPRALVKLIATTGAGRQRRA